MLSDGHDGLDPAPHGIKPMSRGFAGNESEDDRLLFGAAVPTCGVQDPQARKCLQSMGKGYVHLKLNLTFPSCFKMLIL
jgi:hypothetical protein